MKRICVVGSINMDLVAQVDRFPRPGETVQGRAYGTFPGGKGANQAVAAGRLGADVEMIGCVGSDVYGGQYMEVFAQNGVRTGGVAVLDGVSTGIAMIEVEGSGENHIVIVPGANDSATVDYVSRRWETIGGCDILLLQLEIPLDTVTYCAKRGKAEGKTVILDPAPARQLPDALLESVDYLTPNETELEILTGHTVRTQSDRTQSARLLLAKGVDTVIAKAGSAGAYIVTQGGCIQVPGYRVDVVDTTAAGDSFNGGLAYGLAQGWDLARAVELANAVGALAVTGTGAQGAMPVWEQVQALMRKV